MRFFVEVKMMFEIVCVLAFLVALLFPVLAIIHYVKSCNDGEFIIKGKFIKLFEFEISASGTKTSSKKK